MIEIKFEGIVCHHFPYLILTEPPCLAELERIQVQEAAKKKPGKYTIPPSDTVKFNKCLNEVQRERPVGQEMITEPL